MSQVRPDVLGLHKQLLVIDGHSDLLMPIADGHQQLGVQPDRDAKTSGDCVGQYSVAGFRAGGVTAQLCAVFVRDEELSNPLARAVLMIAALHQQVEANADALVLARSSADIVAAKPAGATACVLAFEGAEPFEADLGLVDAASALGTRVIGLSHSRRNAYADGIQYGVTPGGLTRRGFELVERMQERGITVDMAHLSSRGFWDVLEVARRPVIISHTAPSIAVPGYREALDARHPSTGVTRLEALARNGGVVGVVFYQKPTVEAVAEEIEWVIDRVGDEFVSLGSDFYGRDAAPRELNDIGDLPRLTQCLVDRGHAPERIGRIMGQNLLRALSASWGDGPTATDPEAVR